MSGTAPPNTMNTQRRYSITGQTPRGRKLGLPGTKIVTSCKRSATQLPSPCSPSQQLPAKMSRYRSRTGSSMDVDVDVDMDMRDSSSDSEATGIFCEGSERGEDDASLESQATSLPSTPGCAHPARECSLPDAASLERLQLCTGEDMDDDCMEDLALSPPHSRNHSLNRFVDNEKQLLHQSWSTFHPLIPAIPEPKPIYLDPSEPAITEDTDLPLTFLTLPPEIRHNIYRHCRNLVIEKPLVYCISTFDGEMQHPLASVSRQVRSEALAIFYSHNTWVVKVEFRIMYEAFQDWIIRLGEGAGLLRLIRFSVRGSKFRPERKSIQGMTLPGQLVQAFAVQMPAMAPREEVYSPPDGDASFDIDLSEKYVGGRVQLIRNDGSAQAGEEGRIYLGKSVTGLWEKRRAGTLNGQDWVTMVDGFRHFIGGWQNL